MHVFAAAALVAGFAATPASAQVGSSKSWTGSFMGLNAGYGWSGFEVDDPTKFGGGIVNFADFNFSGSGAIAGFQGGYNWQVGSWVLGYESDWQFNGIDGGKLFQASLFDIPARGLDTLATSEIESFGTIRGRIGFLFTPTTLVYATGGFAYGEVKSKLQLNTASNFDRQTHSGYAAGAGFEIKLAPDVSLKTEYLYVGLGDETHTFPIGGDVYTWKERVDLHTVRVGINVRYYGLLDMVLGAK